MCIHTLGPESTLGRSVGLRSCHSGEGGSCPSRPLPIQMDLQVTENIVSRVVFMYHNDIMTHDMIQSTTVKKIIMSWGPRSRFPV